VRFLIEVPALASCLLRQIGTVFSRLLLVISDAQTLEAL
jgi:hypothetical protein